MNVARPEGFEPPTLGFEELSSKLPILLEKRESPCHKGLSVFYIFSNFDPFWQILEPFSHTTLTQKLNLCRRKMTLSVHLFNGSTQNSMPLLYCCLIIISNVMFHKILFHPLPIIAKFETPLYPIDHIPIVSAHLKSNSISGIFKTLSGVLKFCPQ
jgi:hypothetical protein